MAAVKEALAPSPNGTPPATGGKHAGATAQGNAPLPYRAVTAKDLRTLDVPPVQWLVTKIIPRGLLSAIVAQSGTGKTWLMLMLARALATGEMWADRYMTSRCVVGMLDLEGDYTSLKQRWLDLEGGHGQLSDEAAERIFFMSDIGGVNVMDEGIFARIEASIRANAIEVLFVDTLSRTHLLDENSADMRIVMIELERIARNTGCTVILGHHGGKDGSRGARGSSTIKDALQHEVTLTSIEQDGVVTGAKIALTKAKSAPLIKHMMTMHIEELAEDAGVRLVFDDDLPQKGRPSKDDAIEDYLRKHLTAPRQKIQIINSLVENEMCSKGKASEFITQAIEEGKMKCDDKGRIQWTGSEIPF